MISKVLYIVAFVMIAFWIVGFFVYAVGAIVHLLLVIAATAIILNFLRSKRDR